MRNKTLLLALQWVGIGWYIIVCLFAGLFAGIWIDRLIGTEPVFTLLGVLLGTVLAFYGMYRIVSEFMNTD